MFSDRINPSTICRTYGAGWIDLIFFSRLPDEAEKTQWMLFPLLYCFAGTMIECLTSKRDDAFCLSSLRGIGSMSRRLERQKYLVYPAILSKH
jgi:hypothetical protein